MLFSESLKRLKGIFLQEKASSTRTSGFQNRFSCLISGKNLGRVFNIRDVFLLLQAQKLNNKYEQLRDGIHFKSRFV
jgi:hypothetical protein